jgi:hypothetical protein
VADPVIMLMPYDHARNYLLEPISPALFTRALIEAATQVLVEAERRPTGVEKLRMLVATSWNLRRLLQGLLCKSGATEALHQLVLRNRPWTAKQRNQWIRDTALTYPHVG